MNLGDIKRRLAEAELSRDREEHEISTFLVDNSNAFLAPIRARQESVWLDNQLEALVTEHDRLKATKLRLQGERTRLDLRTDQLKVARKALQDARSKLEKAWIELEQSKRLQDDLDIEVSCQRRRICSDLGRAYPIAPASSKDYRLLSIRGVVLPYVNFDDFKLDDVGTALGYTAHLVYLLSAYLNIQLRYSVYPRGNRSYVEDCVSIDHDHGSYPLWPKGIDYQSFEYGVFLLRLDIKQLMDSHGLLTLDIQQTLLNLKGLLTFIQTNR
ncbi:uncharacterized protein V1516DRAFT_664376 [Lipomyces oligophaga]|uniref:uncharacterized protein n=1 Tax=Lipomyces oligophaga TaxID=45792 RepID=UPI0034CEEF5E